MFCTSCGAALTQGNRFCSNCGGAIPASSIVGALASSAASPAPAKIPEAASTASQKSMLSLRTTKIQAVVLVVAVILLFVKTGLGAAGLGIATADFVVAFLVVGIVRLVSRTFVNQRLRFYALTFALANVIAFLLH